MVSHNEVYTFIITIAADIFYIIHDDDHSNSKSKNLTKHNGVNNDAMTLLMSENEYIH